LVQVFNPEGAAYRADLVNVAANGSYNDRLNIGGQLGISGQYRVVVTYDKANEQSLFHFVSSTAPNGGNKTYNLNSGGKAYPLSYQITGAGNKLNNISAQRDNTTLLLNTVAQSNGKLTIELPRNLIDSKKQGNTDEPYAVWEDGQPQAADEINTKNNSQVRTLAIDFDKGTGQIEIAGTKMVPEFGTVAIIIPAIAIIGIIIAGAKYKQFSFRPKQ
jgi:predicted secreted protein with PEFG-CTERM motif